MISVTVLHLLCHARFELTPCKIMNALSELKGHGEEEQVVYSVEHLGVDVYHDQIVDIKSC